MVYDFGAYRCPRSCALVVSDTMTVNENSMSTTELASNDIDRMRFRFSHELILGLAVTVDVSVSKEIVRAREFLFDD